MTAPTPGSGRRRKRCSAVINEIALARPSPMPCVRYPRHPTRFFRGLQITCEPGRSKLVCEMAR